MAEYNKEKFNNVISKRQFDILNYIFDIIEINQFPPSVREICESLNIKSTSTVHKELGFLSEKGYLIKDSSSTRKTRAISISDKGKKLLRKSNISKEDNFISNISNENISNIPVIGSIAAGMPILADGNVEDEIPIPNRFMGRGNNFLLKVRGDSMINAGIFNGDYILVEENTTPNNGDIVVALFYDIDSEATVKTYYKKNGHVELHPENDDYNIINGDNASIIGKVKAVFRYL